MSQVKSRKKKGYWKEGQKRINTEKGEKKGRNFEKED
jgi:hypothetical protein